MSTLKTSTKNALLDYFNNTEFTVTDSEANTKNGCWLLRCDTCQSFNEVRVTTLIQLKRTAGTPCCTACKHRTKVNNFLHRCNMIKIDEQTIQCNKTACRLSYNYSGDYFDHFRCYCQLQIKADEHYVYRLLHEAFPEALLAKEKLYRNKHKVDLYLEHQGKKFYIEIDDESHFAKTGRSQKVDKAIMDIFLQEKAEDVFFIRIPTKAIYKPDMWENLEDFIRTVQNENQRILLFQVSTLNRYLPLGIPEAETEIQQL